jgi:putative selenate reductase molybdopterin-binding subunit
MAAAMSDLPLEAVHVVPAQENGRCSFRLTDGRIMSLSEVATYAAHQAQRQMTVTASNRSRISPPPFTAQFAEVEVDTETGQVTVLRYVAAVDCGVAINPVLAEGQVEGAVTQGLGFALFEEMLFDEQGRLYNPNFADYKLFTALDMPALETILVETHEASGPYGAKSVAEVPVNCPAPAIANAIYDAVGVRITGLPLTAEKILQALRQKRKNEHHS